MNVRRTKCSAGAQGGLSGGDEGASCLGLNTVAGFGAEEGLEVGGCFGLEGHGFSAVGVVEGDGEGVEGDAVVGFVGGTVFFVADDGVSGFGEVNADLVFAAGNEIDFEQAEGGAFFDHTVGGVGEFSFFGVGGGIDDLGAVFGEVAGEDAGGFIEVAVNDGEVFFFGLVPLALEVMFGVFGFGEEQDAGDLAVEAVYDEDAVPGFGIAFPDVVGEAVIGGSELFGIGAHGEESGSLVDDEDVPVFVQDEEALGLVSSGSFFCDAHWGFSGVWRWMDGVSRRIISVKTVSYLGGGTQNGRCFGEELG